VWIETVSGDVLREFGMSQQLWYSGVGENENRHYDFLSGITAPNLSASDTVAIRGELGASTA
jgi:hypothetical protein